jgi:hypothetical protein
MCRGDLTGGPEIVEINGKKYLEVVFCCAKCDYPIVKDSWDHVNTFSKDGEVWYCENCDEECYKEEEEDEDDENDKSNKPQFDCCCGCGKWKEYGPICDCGCSHRAKCEECIDDEDKENKH